MFYYIKFFVNEILIVVLKKETKAYVQKRVRVTETGSERMKLLNKTRRLVYSSAPRRGLDRMKLGRWESSMLATAASGPFSHIG